MTPREAKINLRAEIATRLKSCTPAALEMGSAAVCQRLESLNLNGLIMAYLPMQDEVDLKPFLQNRLGIGVAVPIVDWNARTMHAARLKGFESPHIVKGRHGVHSPAEDQPVEAEEIDAILIPGVAFDRQGHRLGRGGGFYDRFLEQIPSQCLTIGIGFEEQLVEAVPIEEWDRQLDLVVAPQGIFKKS